MSNGNKSLPTYGEAYTRWKLDINDWNIPFHEVPSIWEHSPRMKYHKALIYYSKKLNKIWHNLLSEKYPSKSERDKVIKAVSTSSRAYRKYCKNLSKKEKK